MTDAPIALSATPHAMPATPGARLALFAFRRLGAHGLDDAAAAQAMLASFGQGFRRPLVLMRAMMADLAASAVVPISIAPCCCLRMTHAEHAVLTVLARAETAPESARLLLADLLGIRHADGVFACVMAVAAAFADGGRPIAG
ncbi:hypothetical protein QH494_20455 [Sphingomonas sp. AR_OL41]|uniref:DUF6628 family protein n=1 Tax=Sphingomonas sp. AR_OL41 TaxID=3042729 RepID=UPI002480F25A|nr:DUF6628 family protein [Sphingomonas sp. AR_OL41]MDH7974569.1 hypothetical protein [Sphingomonas sp. AR_OL41]